jgi:hypothetical protein
MLYGYRGKRPVTVRMRITKETSFYQAVKSDNTDGPYPPVRSQRPCLEDIYHRPVSHLGMFHWRPVQSSRPLQG